MAGRLLVPLDFASDADLAIDFVIQKAGQAVDLTGYGVSLAFASSIAPGTGFELTVGNGIHPPGPDGRIKARVAATDMESFAGQYDTCELRLGGLDGSDVAWLLFTARIATGASLLIAGGAAIPTGPIGTGFVTLVANWTDDGIIVDAYPGVAGYDGWSPIFALVADGARNVLKVTAWAGGQGAAPASGVYVGPLGFVTDIHQAVSVGSATALQVSYDNSHSSLATATVQGAIDLLAQMIATLSGKVLPPGGLGSQVLAKASNADFDTTWISLAPLSTPGELDFSDPDNSGLIGH